MTKARDVSSTQENIGGAVPPFTAGKNKLTNGDFSLNQRLFTTTTLANQWVADRWQTVLAGDGTATYSLQTFTPGTAPVAGYEGKNFLRVITSGQTSSGVTTSIINRIEDVRTFAGQTVTVSFWAKAATGTPYIAMDFAQTFGSGGSESITGIAAAKQTISTVWNRYSFNVSIPSISGKTIGTNENRLALLIWFSAGSDSNSRTASMGIQSNTFDIWGVQIEAGKTATPFQTPSGNPNAEIVSSGATQGGVLVSLGGESNAFGSGSNGWAGYSVSGKNFVINGNMNVSQRGVSFTSISSGSTYTLDRHDIRNNGLGTFTVTQESDAPAGFGASLKMLVTTADATLAADDFLILRQKIEGQLTQNLEYGTATAKTTTLSFWVKSNLTGTYIANLFNNNVSKEISASYTINAVDTWEKKAITFPGDVSASIANNASAGLSTQFFVGAGTNRQTGSLQTSWGASVTPGGGVTGQVNLAATVGNYFMITGIQLEIGNVGTPFQTASGTIGGELALCQRYFSKSYNQSAAPGSATFEGFQYSGVNAVGTTTGYLGAEVFWPVRMRIAPTLTTYDSTYTSGRVSRVTPAVNDQNGLTPTTAFNSESKCLVQSASGNAHSGIGFQWTASAEL